MDNTDLQFITRIMSALTNANLTIENLSKENARLKAELDKRVQLTELGKESLYLKNLRLADKANEN